MKLTATLLSLLYTSDVVGSPIARESKIARREVLEALDENITIGDKTWQPVLDFDTDSCYNTAAISPDGKINEGQDHNYSGPSENCRDNARLNNNNVYSRKRCNNGWCAYVYDYYFEKDVAVPHVLDAGGHRHAWEHIIVFVKDDKAEWVAVSRHSGYIRRRAKDVLWSRKTNPKVVYHKQGGGSHGFRFAKEDDDKIENGSGVWFKGPLVSYNGFPSTEIRDKLMNYDFDKERSISKPRMAISDRYLKDNLNWAKHFLIREFDAGVDDAHSPGDPGFD
ncbi:secreted protein [Daldinia sp. FL1419]|nr:secreted protein [Daldinia sp. FL1419]